MRLLKSYVDLYAEMAAFWCLSMSWLLSYRVFWYLCSLSSYWRMMFWESPSRILVSMWMEMYFSRIAFVSLRYLFTICFRAYFLEEEGLVLFYFWLGLGEQRAEVCYLFVFIFHLWHYKSNYSAYKLTEMPKQKKKKGNYLFFMIKERFDERFWCIWKEINIIEIF